ncbi:MAG: tRNA pseudouridine(38-40) synthase TruA [Kiritimatiellaeota bacterium]|nr:tRNA pseudouridine(38-40) synthase TruA [Kiritimatiellota bacterium]
MAHFALARPATPAKLLLGLNALLDDDIRVLALRPARADFHARFSATGKEYRYFIWNDAVLPPPVRAYRWLVRPPLDLGAMQRAAAKLVGRRDFAAFTANPNRAVDGTVRHLRALHVSRRGREVVLRVRGDGFLYKMVRSLAGFLVRVGVGELPPESARTLLAAQQRTAVVPTAPPQGLFLWRVFY